MKITRLKTSPIRFLLIHNIRGRVLDVGCGEGSEAFRTCKRYCVYSVGCEIRLSRLKKAKEHYDSVVQCDARFPPFKPKSFDTVMAIEVIEHLNYSEALELLDNLEGLSQNTVIITTPTALAQPLLLHGHAIEGDKWQRHQCIIPSSILKMRGYKIRGTKLKFENQWLQRLFKPLVYFAYHYATGIIAIKHNSRRLGLHKS